MNKNLDKVWGFREKMVNFSSDVSGTIRFWVQQLLENRYNTNVVYSLDTNIDYPKTFKIPDAEAMDNLSSKIYTEIEKKFLLWESNISFKFREHLDTFYSHILDIPKMKSGELNEEYIFRVSRYISKYTVSWRIDNSLDEVTNNYGDFVEIENRAILLRLEKYLDKWLLGESSVDRYRDVMSIKEIR